MTECDPTTNACDPLRLDSPSRRSAIRAIGALGTVALAGCVGTESPATRSDDPTPPSGTSDPGGTPSSRPEQDTPTRRSTVASTTDPSSSTPTADPSPSVSQSITDATEPITVTVNRGAIDVRDLSGLAQPSARLAEFEVFQGEPGEGEVYVRWDDERFYVAADVRDPTFVSDAGSDETNWQNDAWIVGIGPRPPRSPARFEELAVSRAPEGSTIWHTTQPEGTDSRELTDVAKRVTHSGDRTKMAVAVPWSALALDYDPAVGETLRLSLGQHDVGDVESWRNLGGGLWGAAVPSNHLGTARYGPPIEDETVAHT